MKNKKFSDSSILFSIIFLLAFFVGAVWLELNGNPTGRKLFAFALAGIALPLLIVQFIGEEEIVRSITKIPFEPKITVAAFMFLLGWFIPILYKLIISAYNISFSIAQTSVPLATNTLGSVIPETVAAASAEFSPFWKWFINVFSAGTIEEWIFAFGLMLAGILLGKFFLAMFNHGKELSWISNKNLFFIFGLVLTIATFMGAHKLNNSYTTTTLFIIAGVFRLMMNVLIYKFPVWFTFALGFHQSNNNIWFLETFGFAEWIEAIFSLQGLLVLGIIFVPILYFVVTNIRQIKDDLVRAVFEG